MKALVLCLSVLCSLTVSAQAAPRTENPLNNYYKEMAKKTSVFNSLVRPADSRNDCEPGRPGDRPSCVKTMCDQGAYDCRYQSNLDKVAQLCREGVEGECITSMCKMGAYDCRYQSNLDKVAQLCKNANGRCVKVVCELGAYDCRYQSNLDKTVQLCQGVRASCVTEMCSMGAYDCRYQSNVDKVASLCKQ